MQERLVPRTKAVAMDEQRMPPRLTLARARLRRAHRHLLLGLVAFTIGALPSRAAELAVAAGPDADPVERFAAAELTRYLTRISGEDVPQGEAGRRGTLFVGLQAPRLGARARERARKALAGLDGDSFLLQSLPNGLLLAGASPRGTLYAAYAYLEALGVRWYHPGAAFELVPHGDPELRGFQRIESPDFPTRSLTLARQHIEDYLVWVDFAAKQRLNTVFFHDYGGWWAGQREHLWPEMQKRGLDLQLGGHYLYGFRQDGLFEQHPEWFREVDGKRTPDSNLCVSSQEGLAYWTSQAVDLVRTKMMEADTFHLWPDDGGKWCHCDQCRELSAADQSLALANAFAAGLRGLKAQARVAYLAYGETMTPAPGTVRPAPGVFLLLAPRSRCYGHALDDPNCGKNAQFRPAMEAQAAAMRGADIEVFEYYVDQVRFPTVPNLAPIIPQDLRYYRKLGVANVGPLTLNQIRFTALPVNLFVYPRCEWNLDTDPGALLHDFCERYYGRPDMVAYYDALAAAYQRFVPYYHFDGTRLDLVEAYDRAFGHVVEARSASRDPYLARLRAQEGDVPSLLQEHADHWNLRASGWGARRDQPHEVFAVLPLDLDAQPAQRVTFQCPAAGTYAVTAWWVRGPGRRAIELTIDDAPIARVSLEAAQRAPTERALGRIDLTPGERTLGAARPDGTAPFSAGFALVSFAPLEEP